MPKAGNSPMPQDCNKWLRQPCPDPHCRTGCSLAESGHFLLEALLSGYFTFLSLTAGLGQHHAKPLVPPDMETSWLHKSANSI